MKQVLQDLKTGDTILEESPCLSVSHDSLLIQTTHTLVSAGIERMLVNFGKGKLIKKSRQQSIWKIGLWAKANQRIVAKRGYLE